MFELINKYIIELEGKINQQDLNEQINILLYELESKDNFLSFNINEYIDILKKANYSEEELKVLIDNIKYFKTFINTLDDKEISNHLDNIRQRLQKVTLLIKEVDNQINLKEQYNEVLKLITAFKNNEYIDNINIIFDIFTYYNIPFNELKPYLKEIIEHNKKVNNNFSNNKDNYIDIFVNKFDFNDKEKQLLENYYNNNKIEWEQKYEYLKNTKEFKYIISDINNNKKIFIILMVLSNIDIMNNVLNLCKERNIKIKKMLPNIFVSRNKKFLNISDEFYTLFEGTYEDFLSNLNFLPNDLDLSKVEPIYYITNSNLIRQNYQIFKDYGINLDVNSTICLTIENLKEKLDKIIECGLYSYFKEYPRKILEIKSDLFFYRVKYAKDNNLEYKRKFLSKELFELNGFGINENNYEESYTFPLFQTEEFINCKKIKVDNILSIPILKLFDEKFLQEDNVSYQIGNFLISKNKVQLLLNKYLISVRENRTNKILIIGLMYSILDGMIINKSEAMWLINHIFENLKILLNNELTDEEIDEIVNILFDEPIKKGEK